ncbi:15453_t:CDS:2, partial [Rhizophagus irregularis]
QEIETEVEIPVEIILGSELESLDSTNYPSLTHPIELSVNSKFSSWEIAEHYLKEYGRQKGFVVNKYRVEYIQLSNSTVQIPRRRTFACEYAGKYKPNYKSKQIDQQRNKGGSDYLHDPIYSTRHSWARAFTNRIFTAGIQSTQRVESINAIIHKVVNSSSTMAEVAEALDSRMQKEEINKNFIAWKYKSTIYHQPFVVENFFSNVNNIVQKYFSPRIVGEIHKQMCESIIYKCEKLDIKDAFEFIEDQLDQNEIPENQESQGTSNDQEETNNIEDYYDFRQTYLKSLLNSVPKEMIKEVWPFIGTSSKNLKPIHDDNIDQRIYLNPRHINHVQEVEIRYYTQKKVDYGRIMGHFKKALNYSFDNNDQKNLDDIILAYIAEKETIMTQLERGNVLKDNNTNNQLKLSDGRTYDVDDIGNPLKRQGKGRPATKRLKACNEQKNKASTTQKSQKENVLYEENIENSNGRKCGLCHKMGHYAPKCPNKKN